MAFTLSSVDMLYEVVINGCCDCILRSTGVIDRCVPLRYDFKDVTEYKHKRLNKCPLPLIKAISVRAHSYSLKEVKMIKILEIEKVRKALMDGVKDYYPNEDMNLIEKLTREIMHILPNKPEPITRAKIRDLYINDGLSLDEITDEINTHFLGGNK